jgi:hypothetical protein
MHVRARQKLIRGGQAGWPGANDDGCFPGHSYITSSAVAANSYLASRSVVENRSSS